LNRTHLTRSHSSSAAHPHPLSFPTRRSSDLSGYALYIYLLIALCSVFTVVRHTRAEEQTGRAELVRANMVGRHATLTSAVLLTTDRKSTRLNSSHVSISYAVFCLKKKK